MLFGKPQISGNSFWPYAIKENFSFRPGNCVLKNKLIENSLASRKLSTKKYWTRRDWFWSWRKIRHDGAQFGTLPIDVCWDKAVMQGEINVIASSYVFALQMDENPKMSSGPFVSAPWRISRHEQVQLNFQKSNSYKIVSVQRGNWFFFWSGWFPLADRSEDGGGSDFVVVLWELDKGSTLYVSDFWELELQK